MTPAPPIRVTVKRVYEARERGDGARILVDRLWPRGVRKVDADLDQWRQDLSPSTALRQFYGHRPERFAEFARRYRAELRRVDGAAAVSDMIDLVRRGPITLLTASRDVEHSEAAVLAKVLQTVFTRNRQRRSAGHPETPAGSDRATTKGTRSP